MRIPNRHAMYKCYKDGEITKVEYENYLAEREKKEKNASERFKKTIDRLNKYKGAKRITYETIF